jgi:hypothetical protein
VVRAGVSVVGSVTTDARFFLADFMTILPRKRSSGRRSFGGRGGRAYSRAGE